MSSLVPDLYNTYYWKWADECAFDAARATAAAAAEVFKATEAKHEKWGERVVIARREMFRTAVLAREAEKKVENPPRSKKRPRQTAVASPAKIPRFKVDSSSDTMN